MCFDGYVRAGAKVMKNVEMFAFAKKWAIEYGTGGLKS